MPTHDAGVPTGSGSVDVTLQNVNSELLLAWTARPAVHPIGQYPEALSAHVSTEARVYSQPTKHIAVPSVSGSKSHVYGGGGVAIPLHTERISRALPLHAAGTSEALPAQCAEISSAIPEHTAADCVCTKPVWHV